MTSEYKRKTLVDGYNGPVREQKMVRSGESLTASSQDIPSLEFQ